MKKINKKYQMLLLYTFSEKKLKNGFFNVFWSINDILNKTPFYKYNLCNLNKEENFTKKLTFQCFFLLFIYWWKKTKKIQSFSREYSFSLKLHKLPIFMLLSLFYDNIYFFSKNCINDPFFNVF